MNIYNVLASTTNLEKEKNEIMIAWKNIKPDIMDFGKGFLYALIIYIIGKKLIQWFIKIMNRSIKKSNMDKSVAGFLTSVVKVLLYILLVIMIVGVLGLPTSSLVALIGSAGLTIGFAFQGSLSNFAGGILILLVKPFRVGDYIIVNGNDGVVTAIDLFYTRLTTYDNRMIVLPNGTLSNSDIINVTKEPVRRLDLKIAIGFSENINTIRELIVKVANDNELVLKEYDISVFVDRFDANAIMLGIRVWVDTNQYWVLKCDLLEKLKVAFDQNSITIPYHKIDIIINNEN